MTASIRWGILGAGDVCEVKSGPAFQKARGAELTAVMRRDGEKAADFARRHRVGTWYDSVDGLLGDPDIDAVYVATPPRYHLDHCLAALAAGKHVYLEKPMGMNTAECKAIIEAEAQSRKKVAVAHYRRALPAFRKVGEIIKNGVIGEVRLAEVNFFLPEENSLIPDTTNWRLNPEISGGGLFHDLSPHLLDLLLVYFGQPLEYDGFSRRLSAAAPADDFVQGTILFDRNVVFRGCWCFSVAPCAVSERLIVTGNKGVVSVPFFGDEVTLCTEEGETVMKFDNPVNIQLPMIEAVTNYFLGEADCPCSTADGLLVMEIIDSFTR
ncbi:MAG: Gfo/Idh/MocA family oxidoreductase [Desulfofustis sp.]|jgi:predicted dehydrogenase